MQPNQPCNKKTKMSSYKKIICLTFGLMLSATLFAQSSLNPATEAFAAHFDSLYFDGTRYYAELGNARQLQRVINKMQAYIEQGRIDGVLDSKTADELMISLKMNKLRGDLHYLLTDENASSYGTAESHFRDALVFALDTAHSRLPEINRYKFILHQELGQLYYKRGSYQQAYEEMEAAKEWCNLSEDELLDFITQLAICKARVSRFDEALDDIQLVIGYYQDKDSERYGEALRKKGKILMLKQESLETGMVTPDEEALKCYQEYFALKKADALQRFESLSTEDREPYWMRIRPFVVDCYRMEGADPSFLYDVTLFSKGLLLELNREGGGQQTLSATWRDVQQKLAKKDCAIEFIQYEKNGKQHMGALVLKKTGEPQFISMTDPESVLQYKINSFLTVEEGIRSVHGSDRDRLNVIYQDKNLPQMIWPAELLEAIGKSKHVWFAPDGYQHRIAIEYMLPKKAKFNCHRLTSTRMMLSEHKSRLTGQALIIGGVEYNQNDDQSMQTSGNDGQAYDNLNRISGGRGMFSYLEGSSRESSAIYSSRNNPNDTLLQGVRASEAAFRQLSHSYPIIHVSTHGLYHAAAAPIGTDLRPCLLDNALSESLLALSGINTNISNDDFDSETTDGILSAREIAGLDLSSTDLVVLSCCESGLGHITADGVYGIQRGFKNAGAKALIVTLWDINDNESAIFMNHLNKKLSEGKSIYDAFQSARKYLMRQKDTGPMHYDPFILIDAI